jgi:hypothetical protein
MLDFCLRRLAPRPSLGALVVACGLLAGCGGGETDEAVPSDSAVVPGPPAGPSTPAPGAVVLKAPVLSFTDTGINIDDGVTFNGKWSVESEALAWEYSLDQGQTWAQGSGDFFIVQGDGAKMIWVRARDDFGNTSEIVRVNCVLDTTPPQPVSVTPASEGLTRTLPVAGLEPGARWEYSIDEQTTWLPGAGAGLGVLGNGLVRVWLRQVDLAGNASTPQPAVLEAAGSDAWHEASGIASQPSVLTASPAVRTLLVHGVVARGDADYVRWDIPLNHRLVSVRLLQYVSEDAVSFYALQRSAVFDAGVDVTRMLVYGHMGPSDLARNVVANVPAGSLGAGPMSLWFQQTGAQTTRYAIEVVFEPLP